MKLGWPLPVGAGDALQHAYYSMEKRPRQAGAFLVYNSVELWYNFPCCKGGNGCSPRGGDCMTTLELLTLLNLLFTVIFKVLDYLKK